MEFVILCAVLGAIVGAIARSKGRSFWLWWIYGALLFVIALIHVLVIGTDQKALDAREVAGGDKVKYPDCAELIKAEAKVCRFCGRDVATGAGRIIASLIAAALFLPVLS